MFQFFTKKIFLVDYLANFVDIHNHILPGLDDGAKTVDDAIMLIKSFEDIGVTKIIATPHIMNDYYPNTPKTISMALEVLKGEMLINSLKHISIEAAAEHMIDSNFEFLLDNNDCIPLKRDFILVEMSYLQAPINFEEAIVKISEKHLYAILAHPERYRFLHHKPKKYLKLKEQGILLQLNMLSLSGYYGKDVQKIAHQLLEEGLIDFLASDIHNLDQFNSLKTITLSKKNLETVFPVIQNTIEYFY